MNKTTPGLLSSPEATCECPNCKGQWATRVSNQTAGWRCPYCGASIEVVGLQYNLKVNADGKAVPRPQ